METEKRFVLNRFDIVSKIMPYYAETHKCFLLLSSLCKQTRERLDEFYDEFRRHMVRYSFVISAVGDYINALFLPCDLFTFFVIVRDSKQASILTKFAQDLKDTKGYYFNKHYMHEQICFEKIIAYSSIIEAIYPYFEAFESIKVVNYYQRASIYEDEIDHKMIDQISFAGTTHSQNILPQFSTENKILPHFVPFKRAFIFNSIDKSFKYTLDCLKLLK